MREIKTRVWDRNRNQWLHPASYRIDGYGKIWLNAIEQPHVENDEWLEIVEFTGLKDKNGKEIYGGDIVSVPYVNPVGQLDMTTEDHKSTIVFENGGFKLTHYGSNEDISYWQERGQTRYVANYGNVTELLPHTKLTIIGNIYENPELLK